MPRFFLNVRTESGEFIPDPEGDELMDVEQSYAEAVSAAKDLLAKGGADWIGSVFEVSDERGRAVFELPFADAVRSGSKRAR